MRFKGTIKWFNNRTGVGAILLDDGNDVIVETTAVFGEVGETLTDDEIVELEPISGVKEPHLGEEVLLYPGEEVLLHRAKESQVRKVRIQTSGHPIKLRDIPTVSDFSAEYASTLIVSKSDHPPKDITQSSLRQDVMASDILRLMEGEVSLEQLGVVRSGRMPILSPSEQPQNEVNQTRPIHLLIDPGEASVKQIRDVLSALNQLNIAAGGLGFTFDIDGDKVAVLKGHHL